MQQKTQTKKYTTWQNTIYMLKKVWGWSKKDILISLLHIPPSVISPLILVVLSKILVDCLTVRGDTGATDHNGRRCDFDLRRVLLAG